MNFRGVTFDKSIGKFKATMSINGYKLLLGEFDDAIDAAERYNDAVRDRKNGVYSKYDDAYREYIEKVEALSRNGVECNADLSLISSTSPFFVEWMGNNLVIGGRLHKADIYNSYINDNPNESMVSQRQFSFWLDKYFRFKDLLCYKGRDSKGRWIEVVNIL